MRDDPPPKSKLRVETPSHRTPQVPPKCLAPTRPAVALHCSFGVFLVRTHTRETGLTVDAAEEMVLRDPGLSATPHVVKAAAATKATLMLLLTR